MPCAEAGSIAAWIFGTCPDRSPYVTGEFPLAPLSIGFPYGIDSCEDWAWQATHQTPSNPLPLPAPDHECWPVFRAQARITPIPRLPGQPVDWWQRTLFGFPVWSLGVAAVLVWLVGKR